MAESVHAAVRSEADEQRRELRTLVTGEVESALKGPLGTRLDERNKKVLEASLEEYARKRPSINEDAVRRLSAQVAEGIQLEWASTKLQKIVAEAVRSAVTSASAQQRAEMTATVSSELEAVRGPLTARLDATIEETLGKRIEQHFQAPSAIAALQQWVAEAVRQPLEAEYEQRALQIQSVVASQIETAVRGPIAAQMDQMLTNALEAQRAEYARNPPPITDETLRLVTANIAQHPALQASIDALGADLTQRWTGIARDAMTSAQQDLSVRIAATERLTQQVVAEIQQRIEWFGSEMNRLLGAADGSAPPENGVPDAEPERDKKFREVLQSTGSHFEREMKAVLQKIFGKS